MLPQNSLCTHGLVPFIRVPPPVGQKCILIYVFPVCSARGPCGPVHWQSWPCTLFKMATVALSLAMDGTRTMAPTNQWTKTENHNGCN
eukprot:210573-Lingulodinium_polyedra.AAC.1